VPVGRSGDAGRAPPAAGRTLDHEWPLVFDAVECAILVVDLDGTVLRLNRAAVDTLPRPTPTPGTSLAALGGQPWRQIGDLLGMLRETEEATSCRMHDRAGRTGWELAARRYTEPGSGARRVVVLVRALRGSVAAPMADAQAERMAALGALVAGVAHEVKDPLFGMSATLDAFEARFGVRAEHEAYLQALREELNRLKLLMQDLMNYGHAATLVLAPGELQDVLADAVRECVTLARAAGVRVRVAGTEPLGPSLIDRRRLVQAFENLVKNAIQHSPSGGEVVIAARECTLDEAQVSPESPTFWAVALKSPETPAADEPWLECSISDEGHGFRTEDLPRVFDPFFTRRRGGTGLGLPIAQRIVEAHGGHLIAGNRPEGGAVLVVRIPRRYAVGTEPAREAT
jgi:signal transduction histidine kinase